MYIIMNRYWYAWSFLCKKMEDFSIESRVFAIKERDERGNFAEFVGAMVHIIGRDRKSIF